MMKFSALFIAIALATSLCDGQKPLRRSSRRRKNKEERKLSLSYLVNHFNHQTAVESENNDVTGRAEMLFDNDSDRQIVGVHFLPIYADSDPNDGPVAAKEFPKEAPKELPKEGPKEVPKLGPGGFNRGEKPTRKKKYVVRHKVIRGSAAAANRNGSGASGVSKAGSKGGSKHGGKYKTNNRFYSECREQCQHVPFDADPFRTPVCDASSMSVLEWLDVAENDCCCSEGISFLKLSFDTMYYGENFQLGGSVSVVSDAVGAESIHVVDCFDSCLRNPMRNAVCSSARYFHDQVVTGTEICIVQLDERNIPRFDWNFPTTLEVQFESTVQERFVAAIDTSCGIPPVSPWAAVAYPEGMAPTPYHINTENSQADGFNFPIFMFTGGMSTGAFQQALDNPFQEAGYQLGLEQCGCNCADFPPTEAPTWGEDAYELETDTLPPTIDFSCAPSAVPEEEGRTREIIPISHTATEEQTEPPTVLFSVPSPVMRNRTPDPTSPPTSPRPTFWPTRTPVAPPTAIPTIRPTSEPTATPTDQPTSEPTATPTVEPTAEPTTSPTAEPTGKPSAAPSEKPTMPRISKAAVQGGTSCSTEGSKSIYDYICQVSNFSNFCRMVERAGLVELLDGSGDYDYLITMFIPTNRGMKSNGLNRDQIDATDVELLKHIVLTHGTAGKIEAQDLQCDAELPTLEGTYSVHSTKCFTTTHAKAQIGFFNSYEDYPMVLFPNNIELCNGFVQPVNNMLRVINF